MKYTHASFSKYRFRSTYYNWSHHCHQYSLESHHCVLYTSKWTYQAIKRTAVDLIATVRTSPSEPITSEGGGDALATGTPKLGRTTTCMIYIRFLYTELKHFRAIHTQLNWRVHIKYMCVYALLGMSEYLCLHCCYSGQGLTWAAVNCHILRMETIVGSNTTVWAGDEAWFSANTINIVQPDLSSARPKSMEAELKNVDIIPQRLIWQ